MAVEQFEKSNGDSPIRPKAHLDSCLNCSGSGLVAAITSYSGYRKLSMWLLLVAV
jgi:hypothetical protein